jgi:hypothetical protein
MSYTRKNKRNKIQGELLVASEGWKKIRIYGAPYDRGYAHGFLLARELKTAKQTLMFIVREFLKMEVAEYMKRCKNEIRPIVKNKCPELYNELRGISAGARAVGVSVSVAFLIAWNSTMSLYPRNVVPNRCSAFIATGSATESGEIVMAHNTHTDFVSGSRLNIIMYVEPTDGHSFVMQTAPGYIASSTDWFLCSSGIIGCETTITKVNFEPDFKKGHPYFCRIRSAMQYAKTLDECSEMMLDNNAGDYACSWLFGNINTNEIMILELGMDVHSIQRTHNGVLYGMNSAMDMKLRNTETEDHDHTNELTSVGARNNRLNHLLNEEYAGKINIQNARRIISDHYDAHFARLEMTSRTICKHSELDEHTEFKPVGCTDAKVTDTKMASKMGFYGIFGSACGRKFIAKEHIRKHPEYKHWAPHLKDIPKYKWTKL